MIESGVVVVMMDEGGGFLQGSDLGAGWQPRLARNRPQPRFCLLGRLLAEGHVQDCAFPNLEFDDKNVKRETAEEKIKRSLFAFHPIFLTLSFTLDRYCLYINSHSQFSSSSSSTWPSREARVFRKLLSTQVERSTLLHFGRVTASKADSPHILCSMNRTLFGYIGRIIPVILVLLGWERYPFSRPGRSQSFLSIS